jgi:hypothetical protein
MSATSASPTRSKWVPAAVVAGVLLIVTFGGWVMALALAEPAGHPVGLPGVVSVQPLSGWQFAGRSEVAGAPFVRVTRGGANLDVVALGASVPDHTALAERYVDGVLRRELDRLSVSTRITDLVLHEGTQAARFSYVGVAPETGQPIEGEVTVVVTPSGQAVVFDAWAAEGQFAYAQADLRTMISRAVLA